MRNTDRVLTTHVGSLPRPEDLIQTFWAEGEGEEVDETLLERRVAESVSELVAQQRAVGIDIVGDGEFSKPGFTTYIYERYAGFGKELETPLRALDFEDYPELDAAYRTSEAVKRVRMRYCESAIALKDPAPGSA